MGRILFAWVGMTDLRCAKENDPGELGPIGQVVAQERFERLVLLDNYGEKADASGYIGWLRGICNVAIDLVPVCLPSPTDFAAIYVSARKQVENALQFAGRSATPVFHLSPGTPAMAAIWIMLAKGPFPEAQLLQSSKERGVEWVEMPFNIQAEFIPDLIKGADRRLLSLFDDAPLPEHTEFSSIIHSCNAMKHIVTQARLVAFRDVPILIEGETGTGKELFANAIHRESLRSTKPFVSVNCGAIPSSLFEAEIFGYIKGAFTGAERDYAGYFEQAQGGTLFLDEVGELPPDAQVKILRILDGCKVRRLGESVERPVDVRIITATNRNLIEEVAVGRFRSDLFYRLAVAMLKLPPLREREGDMGLLLDGLLEQVNVELAGGPNYKKKKFSIKAKNLMLRHPWPGNAREMKNTLSRICVWCQGAAIQAEDVERALLPSISQNKDDILSRSFGENFKLQKILDDVSSHYIKKALMKSGNNKTQAARLLGFSSYQTMTNRIKNLGLDIGKTRSEESL